MSEIWEQMFGKKSRSRPRNSSFHCSKSQPLRNYPGYPANAQSLSNRSRSLPSADSYGLTQTGAENVRAWLLTDSARKLAIARRLDGIPWAKINAKSWTLPKSWGHWPIGITEAQAYPAIGLVEGTPDFLSLIAQAWTSQVQNLVAPVCMSGAAMSIPESVLPRFRSKRVRIFMHDDNPGISAVNRCAEQPHSP